MSLKENTFIEILCPQQQWMCSVNIKYLMIFPECNQIWISVIFIKSPISNFTEIHQVGVVLICTNRWMGGSRDIQNWWMLFVAVLLHLNIGGNTAVEYWWLKRYDILCIMVQQEPIYWLSSRQTDLLYFIFSEDLFYRMHKTHYSVGHAVGVELCMN